MIDARRQLQIRQWANHATLTFVIEHTKNTWLRYEVATRVRKRIIAFVHTRIWRIGGFSLQRKRGPNQTASGGTDPLPESTCPSSHVQSPATVLPPPQLELDYVLPRTHTQSIWPQ
jgi:hypothetical protein